MPVPPMPGSSQTVLGKYKQLRSVALAKREIKTRTLNIFTNLWWKFMPGVSIIVDWPVGKVIIDDTMSQYDWSMSAQSYVVDSADPNDHFRPWLERNVGRQGWDWDWRISPKHTMYIPSAPQEINDSLEIKFRKGKEIYASIAKLQWM